MKKEKKVMAVVCLILVVLLSGCQKKEEKAAQYHSSREIFDEIWSGVREEDKFPCYGGTIENSVESAPGNVSLSDPEVFNYMFWIPEDIVPQIKDAASLTHSMNANTFTGVVLKVDGDQKAFIQSVKDSVMSAQFLCGFPDEVLIGNAGDYVVYAFGKEDNIENFKRAAEEKIPDIRLETKDIE